MLKKTIMMLALMAMTAVMYAQTKFHDAEVHEAKGPVKSIINEVMGQTQTINFTPEGKMQQEGMTNAVYDADGYLLSYTLSSYGQTVDIKLNWENGVVKSQNMTAMGQTFKTSYQYDEQGKVTGLTNEGMGASITVNFTNIQYDAQGNWISRTNSAMGGGIEQTRTIEYYE